MKLPCQALVRFDQLIRLACLLTLSFRALVVRLTQAKNKVRETRLQANHGQTKFIKP